MAKKKNKLATPQWILEGYNSPEDYEKACGGSKKEVKKVSKKKGKGIKVKICPKCGSEDVCVVLSGNDTEEESNTGKEWECRECKWKGVDVDYKELSEDEFMEYLDKRGEEIA